MISSLNRFFRKQEKTRSPLYEKDVASLRYPGQSIQKMRDDTSDYALFCVMTTYILCAGAGFSWWSYLDPSMRFATPLAFSIFSVISLVTLLPIGLAKLGKARKLREARNGEQFVAEHLNQLIADGYTVLHDIPCHEARKRKRKVIFNIDHLLIGPAGIFAVETKTMCKLDNGKDYKLTFNGKEILRFGKPLKHDPIKQSVNQARWLENELTSVTNKRFSVTPIVTFLGWYMTYSTPPTRVRVLGTPKIEVLRSILSKKETRLSQDDIALIVNRIKLQIQTAPL